MVNAGRVPEEGVKSLKMVAKRLLGLLEPRENAAIALVKNALGSANLQPRNDLVDELALSVGRQSFRSAPKAGSKPIPMPPAKVFGKT